MQRSGASEQVESLKYETNLFVANARQFVIVELAYQLRVEPILPPAGRIQTTDQIHESGLARARWSHDSDVLIAPDLEVDSA